VIRPLTRAGRTPAAWSCDAFGTKILEGYFTATGGGYCVCEAPDAASVVKSHEAMGVPLDKSAVEEIAGTLT
jgi:hypothetical protein